MLTGTCIRRNYLMQQAASSNYVELSPGGRGNRENNIHI